MKATLTDWSFPDLLIEENILRGGGHEFIARSCGTEAELIALTADADVVITQFARLNAPVIGAMNRARAIVRYGIGVDNIDLEAARARGIPVCNVPDYCIDEVADHTMALLLGLTRQVPLHNQRVHAGQWGLAGSFTEFHALRDLVIGVAGFGRIGREVVKRLLAFKSRVLVFDPVVPPADISRAGAEPVATLEALLPRCDVFTPHCPSTKQTRRMLNATTLAQLKRGVLLINVSRGDLVDTAALVSALDSGHVAAAGLDVCDPEPIPAGHPLLGRSNVILAPHSASVSERAVRTLREAVATLALTALRGELPPTVVNAVTQTRSCEMPRR